MYFLILIKFGKENFRDVVFEWSGSSLHLRWAHGGLLIQARHAFYTTANLFFLHRFQSF